MDTESICRAAECRARQTVLRCADLSAAHELLARSQRAALRRSARELAAGLHTHCQCGARIHPRQLVCDACWGRS